MWFRAVNMANLFNWLFSDSSSDEEPNQRNRKKYRTRRNSDESDFRRLYRFDRENFDFLVNHFLFNGEQGEEMRGGSLNSAQKMKIFLRYVGDPGFQVKRIPRLISFFTSINEFLRLALAKISVCTKLLCVKLFGMCVRKFWRSPTIGWIFLPTKRNLMKQSGYGDENTIFRAPLVQLIVPCFLSKNHRSMVMNTCAVKIFLQWTHKQHAMHTKCSQALIVVGQDQCMTLVYGEIHKFNELLMQIQLVPCF